MKQWYLQQTPRDQRIVIALAVLVLLAMIYVLLIHPLKTGLESRRVSVAAKQETLVWMQQSAAQVQRLRGSVGGTGKPSNKAAYVLLDEAIRNAGLAQAAERVEPAGKDKKGARAQFSQVDFDKLVRTLSTLQAQHGLSVVSVNIGGSGGNGQGGNGLVSARVTLEYEQ